MFKITVEWVMSLGPCYTHDRVIELFDGREYLTPMEIAAADIPIEDRLWILLRPEIISEKNLHLLTCEFVEEILPIFEKKYPDNKYPRQIIEAKRKWIKGEITDEELSANKLSAQIVKVAASVVSPLELTMSVAWETARIEVEATLPSPIRYSSQDAANAAFNVAWGIVKNKQLDHVIEILKNMESVNND